MTVHSGALRLKTPGDGEVVDITQGVVRVLEASEVDRGVVNVFAVGFPLKVGVALLIVAASLPFLGGWMSSSLAGAVGSSLASLGR